MSNENLPEVEAVESIAVPADANFGLSEAAALCDVTIVSLNSTRKRNKIRATKHSFGWLYKGAELVRWNQSRSARRKTRDLHVI